MTLKSDSKHVGVNLANVAVVVLAILVQLIAGGHLSLFGAVPDFMLVAVFLIAVKCGQTPGVVCGFALGLLYDLVGSSTVGLSALIGAVFGYACAVVCAMSLLREPARAAVRFFLCNLAYYFVLYTVMVLLGAVDAAGATALATIVLSSLLNSVLAFVVFLVHSKFVDVGPVGWGK